MKKLIIPIVALSLCSSCHTHKWSASSSENMLIGTWGQQDISLEFKANGRYLYHYSDGDYSNVQSGKFRYFPNRDSIVLYDYYPDAYTPESKNESWSICKLTPDTLTVYVHKNIVVLDNDTLNTAGNEINILTKCK